MKDSIFSLEIITPLGAIFKGQVNQVRLPGKDGEFGVLQDHSSLVTVLNPGLIEINHTDQKIEKVVVDWGYVEVTDEKTIILVDDAVVIDGDDQSEIAQAINRSKAILSRLAENDPESARIMGNIENHAKTL